MAREIVRRWQPGDSLYILPVRRKVLLIEEMLDGPTLDDDEQAILTLLRGSTDAELAEVLAKVGRRRLLDDFHGEELEQLESLLAAREGKARVAKEEGFPRDTVLELQQRFTSNAALEHDVRLNCILIVRERGLRVPALREGRLRRLHHRPHQAGNSMRADKGKKWEASLKIWKFQLR
ncbi:MAG TPA: hypothetical protein VGS57_07840 [Thermoanaerobaculia bacterium]|jgi:hypothetical protein|nr:hypothetical protein [Thermoanaerobaculia bacterium]